MTELRSTFRKYQAFENGIRSTVLEPTYVRYFEQCNPVYRARYLGTLRVTSRGTRNYR